MSVLLPVLRIASFGLVPRLFSGNQEGALGGADLPIPRMGDRWSAEVRTAQLKQDAPGRELIAALTMATTLDARMPLTQPHVAALPAGSAPVVDSSNASGTTLAVRGIPTGTLLERGRYLSILHLGVHHVHMVSQPVTVGASGKAAIPVWPMLRFLTIDGERVYLDEPIIEGRLVGFDKGARFVRNRVDPLEFSIVERS